MKITYENDLTRGAGNGILRCAEAPFTEGAISFEVQRASDRLFLSDQGWLPQSFLLSPAAAHLEGGELLLRIGAGIVNQLDTQEAYRVKVHTAGDTLSAVLRVQDVLFGPETPLNNALNIPSPAQHTPAAQVTAAPPAPEVPESTEADTAASAESAEEKPEESCGLGSLDRLDDTPQTAPKKSVLPLFVGVGLLILLLAGAGAWWFMRTPPPPPLPQENAQAEKTPAPKPDPKQEKPAQEKAAPKEEDKQPQPAPATAQAAPSAAERVTLFFGGQERTPQAAAALSRELPKGTPVEQDAVYRLYYFAGENGETSVLTDYAACLDPTLPNWGSINKDAPAAWAIYDKAKAAGDAKAAAAQANLKAWLDKQAAGGNAQAKFWLDQLR